MVAGGRDLTRVSSPGPRPTIRLAYLLELVVAVAVSASLSRDLLSEPRTRAILAVAPASEWVRLLGGAILTGLAISGGVGLAIESVRGRRPSSWGLGRWIWSISGIYVALSLAIGLVFAVATYFRQHRKLVSNEVLHRVTRFHVSSSLLTDSAVWFLTALCATAMFAGSPRDPEPDAREWLGRVFASVCIATMIALRTLQAIGS
jgi:hypothetical protein